MSTPGERQRDVTGEAPRREILNRGRSSSHQALVRAVLTHSANLLEPEHLDGLILRALAATREFLPLDACQIAMLSADGVHAEVHASTIDSRIEHQTHPANLGLLGRVLQSEEPILIGPDAIRDIVPTAVDVFLLGYGPQAVALLQLRASTGRICGALMCSTGSYDAYTPEQMLSLRMFALQLAASVELVQARRDLRHWNAIVRFSQVAILGKDQHGKITHWNPAAERLYGYAAHEVLGQSIAVLVPADKKAELDEVQARLRMGESIPQLDTVHVTKDGRRLDVVLTISCIRDSAGQIVGSSTVARDNTETRLANERFRLAVESAPNAMILCDEQGKILLINAEAERLFGYTRDELVGKGIEVLLPESVRARHAQHRSDFMRNSQKRTMGVGRDLWALSKSGKQIPVEVGLNPIQGESERTVLASIVDISERSRIEAERQRLLLEAQQAVEARDTFLSIASHELKTPLTALQLTTQALLRAAQKAQPGALAGSQLTHKLTSANRQVTKLGKLIDQLLDVSRLTTGPLILERSHADLGAVLAEVVERFAQTSEGSAIRVPEPREVLGNWDAARLDQVFTNLLANAIKYGEGRPIDVTLDDAEDSVTIAVTDRGRGIAPQDQARIFERFERLVSHRHYGGFGLGLWIVRQLVEAHRGRIEVVSRPSEGTTFRVWLPKWVG